MYLTQTPTDAALTFLLGVIAAIIGTYLYLNAAPWWSKFLTRRANSSKKSAEDRVKLLRRELLTIEELQSDLTQYVGRLIEFSTGSVFFLIASTGIGLVILHLISLGVVPESGVDVLSNPSFRVAGQELVLAVVFCMGVYSVIFLATSLFLFSLARRYSDLKSYAKRIQEQIDPAPQALGCVKS
jgi:hypothetical protein